jgi:hypothetical protein
VRASDLTGAVAVALALALAAPASAQVATPSRVAVDASVAVDETVSEGGSGTAGFIADALVSVDLGGNVQFITRPYAQRVANSAEWNAQVWVAALRYERPGPVGIRVDGGFIPSPMGMANLLLRPQSNPTIAQPSSLFTPLPQVAPGAPRATLLGALYPLGVSATASALKWDARAAVIDSSPLRTRRVFADYEPPNPPRFTNVVVGGGITPFVGFRVGASLAHGGWLQANEVPGVAADRSATIVTLESEFSYRYTKVLGEWTLDRIGTDEGRRTATGFFVQGQQTLAPRWFAAGRVERIGADASTPGALVHTQHLTGTEETLGYRLTADLTVRVSHRARETFGVRGFTQSAAVSVVWWKRLL